MPILPDVPALVQFPFEDFADADAGRHDVPEVDGEILTLEDWLCDEASYYASLGTGAGRFLAGELRTLAAEAKALRALTPDDFDARRAVMDAHVRS